MTFRKFLSKNWVPGVSALWLIALLATAFGLMFGHDIKAAPFNLLEKKTVVSSSVVVEIGESGKHFAQQYKEMVVINDRNPGSHFYRINWPNDALGAIVVKNGSSSLVLDSVFSVLGDADDTYPEEGIASLSVSMGLPPRNNVLHDDARLKFYALLQRIQEAGWKRWIDPSMPRLNGADALRYQMSDIENGAGLMSLDPSYVPSLDIWMKIKDMTGWQFYLNGVYMNVQLMRDKTRMDPNLPGAYFLTLGLESKDSFERSEQTYEDRPRWKELYPAARKKQAEERVKSEEKLHALGFKIDTEYRNPDE
ncbi:hypothetical protein CFter6_0113 [Collimonas fungivorans]|uniref:Uncharacterized protein n=1 Tax=Collimonas fungivorans TaxID=158899 RepID=A0A127P596_9BURK|nr:hypothetical protein [Collimonas fungivorans]AMO92844.1 hypothetical protein CFter6_0113 [Collimonas fungivorans]